MNKCLWCDAPTSEKLCAPCRAVNDHPPYYCKADPRHTVPTLGDHCAECALEAEREARRKEQNAPILEALQTIRTQHVAGPGNPWPWPGCEFGKAIIGRALDKAIEELS